MVCVCALFSLTGCYNTEPRESVLKIYNWADYIDVKSLIDNPNIFPRLFFVPPGKFRQHILINVIGPIIYFQHTLTRLYVIASG